MSIKLDKQYIGIDPGLSGAIVMLRGDKVFKTLYPKIGKELDLHKIAEIFKSFDKTRCHLIIEDVSAIPGGSAKANWSFSRSKAILETLAVANNLPFTLVRPKAWQKIIHQGIPKQKEAKDMTLMAVKRLYPEMDLRAPVEKKYYADSSANRKKGVAGQEIPARSTKPHDGIYDALAMAHYCKVIHS